MPVFMVHKNWAGACFVKDLDFFISQGGETKDWGKAWSRVLANNIEDARRICKETIEPTPQKPVASNTVPDAGYKRRKCSVCREGLGFTESDPCERCSTVPDAPPPERISVQPEWCLSLPLQQQSVLFLGARGSDGIEKVHRCKAIQRAYRATVFKAAKCGRLLDYGEKADSFMSLDRFADDVLWSQDVADFFDGVDGLPHHGYQHLMLGCEILGYKHPDERFRRRWLDFYLECVKNLHCNPETEAQMDERLSDWHRKSWDIAARADIAARSDLRRWLSNLSEAGVTFNQVVQVGKQKQIQPVSLADIERIAASTADDEVERAWQSMESAPKNATYVLLKLKDGSTVEGHWAQDYSGECQPPFDGWFDHAHREILRREIDRWMPL